MAERFFLNHPIVDQKAILDDDQAHHLLRVMRAKAGDSVALFDGLGNEYEAVIDEASKKRVLLRVESSTFAADPNHPEVIVACALPKGDRQKFVVEKLVELGANRLIPLATARGVAEANEKVIGRIEKQVIEASKQCRRNWLMSIGDPCSVESLIESFKDFAGSRLLADPYSTSHDLQVQNAGCVIAVGPEGGFTDEEVRQFTKSGWSSVCFSPNVLRIETAATAAVAIARQANFKKSLS